MVQSYMIPHPLQFPPTHKQPTTRSPVYAHIFTAVLFTMFTISESSVPVKMFRGIMKQPSQLAQGSHCTAPI